MCQRFWMLSCHCLKLSFPSCAEYTPENPKIMTKCSHHFHLGCIYEWMERSDSCPVCGKVTPAFTFCKLAHSVLTFHPAGPARTHVIRCKGLLITWNYLYQYSSHFFFILFSILFSHFLPISNRFSKQLVLKLWELPIIFFFWSPI